MSDDRPLVHGASRRARCSAKLTLEKKHCSDRIKFRTSKFEAMSEDKSKLNIFLQSKGQTRKGAGRGLKAESTKHTKSRAGQEMDQAHLLKRQDSPQHATYKNIPKGGRRR